MERKPQGFFAYSSIPASSGDAIESAVREINSNKEVHITTWINLARGGSLVIDDILTAIERSDFVCFDLTGMNDNVLFELGFAIARKKPVWVVFDTSFEESQRKWSLLGLLQDITYVGYHNNHDIVRRFNEQRPHEADEIMSRLVQLYVTTDSQPEILLYLKQQIQTTASGVIDLIIEERQVPVLLDDPSESKVQTLAWYIQNIYNCVGVLSELSSSDRSGHVLQNMKCSFISGLAKGMEKRLYMVAEQPYNPPSDYRSLVNRYSRIDKIERGLRSFLNDVKSDAVKILASPRPKQQSTRKKNALQSVSLGEWIAEHEQNKIYEYYVETKHITSLIKNEHNIIVGRKGCGKTASFYYLNDYFSNDTRNIICPIKPNSFQIDALLYLLKRARENYQVHYLVEISWKFLIFTEIARAFYERVSQRPIYALSQKEQDFIEYVDNHKAIVLSDFSSRLENKLLSLHEEFDEVLASSQHEFMAKISEHLHNTVLYEIRDFVSEIAPKNGRVVVLVDNLDKSWKVNNDLVILSEWVLGLLSVSGRIASDISVIKSKGTKVEFTLTIFLRSDILKRVLQASREPDKIGRTELVYDDKEVLLRIVDERYEILNKENSESFSFWDHYVVGQVAGEDVKDFIFSRVFPRPRDLLIFISKAKDTAVARGHARIEEADLLEAHALYSKWVLSSLFVENGVTQEQMQDFIYHLAGNSQIVSEEEIVTAMQLANIEASTDDKIEYFIDHLVALSILGRAISDGKFVFEYDLNVSKRNKIFAGKAKVKRFKIHNALLPALELT